MEPTILPVGIVEVFSWGASPNEGPKEQWFIFKPKWIEEYDIEVQHDFSRWEADFKTVLAGPFKTQAMAEAALNQLDEQDYIKEVYALRAYHSEFDCNNGNPWFASSYALKEENLPVGGYNSQYDCYENIELVKVHVSSNEYDSAVNNSKLES